jgi:hypothetical protein
LDILRRASLDAKREDDDNHDEVMEGGMDRDEHEDEEDDAVIQIRNDRHMALLLVRGNIAAVPLEVGALRVEGPLREEQAPLEEELPHEKEAVHNGEEGRHSKAVAGGRIYEVCLCQDWNGDDGDTVDNQDMHVHVHLGQHCQLQLSVVDSLIEQWAQELEAHNYVLGPSPVCLPPHLLARSLHPSGYLAE